MYGNYFLSLYFYLFYSLDNHWYFDYFLYYSFDVLIYPYDLRYNFLNLDYLWNFDKFGTFLLNFVNSRDDSWPFYNFLYDLSCCDDLLDFWLDWNNFLNDCWDLFDYLLNVRNYFLNLFYLLVNYNFLYLSFNVFDFKLLLFDLNNFLDELRYLDYFLYYLSNN